MLDATRIALGAAFLLALSDAAHAAPANAAVLPGQPPEMAYDGVWIIDATTSGLCLSKGKRIFAQLNSGKVSKFAGLPGAFSGGVTPDGAVSFVLKAYGFTATVRGKMGLEKGAGEWSSNSPVCARGAWSGYVIR